MAVPTYRQIADSEIDPNSPITSRLVTALRNNVLALLGIDTATASPTFTLPPSSEAVSDVLTFSAVANDTATTSTLTISVRANALETWRVAAPAVLFDSGATNDHLAQHAGWGGLDEGVVIDNIEAVYVSGTPSSVKVAWSDSAHITSTVSAMPSNGIATIPLTDTWTAVRNMPGGNAFFEAKASYDATNVYLTFRMRDTAGGTQKNWVYIRVIRTVYHNKADA